MTAGKKSEKKEPKKSSDVGLIFGDRGKNSAILWPPVQLLKTRQKNAKLGLARWMSADESLDAC